MFLPLLLLNVLTISFALSYGIVPQNVITVPPNCPEGQEFINGQCRDVWRNAPTTPLPPSVIQGKSVTPVNMVTVPTNCPPGQQLINGQCRDVWKEILAFGKKYLPSNMITVPTNCPPGQQFINGRCRDVWNAILAESKLSEQLLNNQWARLSDNHFNQHEEVGNGSEKLLVQNGSIKNIISVPTQCPAGYRPDALGICRKIL